MTLSGSTVNQKVRVEVRCFLWAGQSEGRHPCVDLSAVAQGRSPQVTQHRHFVTPSESSSDSLRHPHELSASLLHHDATSHLRSHRNSLQASPAICLYFFGFPITNTHKHSLSYTIQTEATSVKMVTPTFTFLRFPSL